MDIGPILLIPGDLIYEITIRLYSNFCREFKAFKAFGNEKYCVYEWNSDDEICKPEEVKAAAIKEYYRLRQLFTNFYMTCRRFYHFFKKGISGKGYELPKPQVRLISNLFVVYTEDPGDCRNMRLYFKFDLAGLIEDQRPLIFCINRNPYPFNLPMDSVCIFDYENTITIFISEFVIRIFIREKREIFCCGDDSLEVIFSQSEGNRKGIEFDNFALEEVLKFLIVKYADDKIKSSYIYKALHQKNKD